MEGDVKMIMNDEQIIVCNMAIMTVLNTIPAFVWTALVKPRNNQLSVAGNRTEMLARYLLKTCL